MSIVVDLAVAAALLYVLVAVLAWGFQRRLMYIPDPQRRPPAEAGVPGVREVLLTAPDGATLIAWFTPARPGQPTLLYFHGNGGHLADRRERIAAYRRAGQGVFMLAYRGYAGSSGSPSEAANLADARLAYEHLRSIGIDRRDIVLYGESLGSGVAVQTAAQVPVGGVILDAPYTSIREVAGSVYWFLPVNLLLVDRYETLAHIGRVTAPLLVLHGERDAVIPVEMGRRVHDAALAARSRRLVTFPQAGHSDHYLYGSFDAVQTWLAEVRQQPAAQ